MDIEVNNKVLSKSEHLLRDYELLIRNVEANLNIIPDLDETQSNVFYDPHELPEIDAMLDRVAHLNKRLAEVTYRIAFSLTDEYKKNLVALQTRIGEMELELQQIRNF